MAKPKFPRLAQIPWSLAIALSCTGAIVTIQQPVLKDLQTQTLTPPKAELERQLEQEAATLELMEKMPVFGFDNLVANWAYLKFLEYFGDNEARRLTGYQLSPEYFDVVIRRDPRFLDAYLFLSGSTSLYAGQPERTIELMDYGLKFLSPQVPKHSYYIWRYRAIDELLFLGDSKAAQTSFEKAAAWAETYSDPESQQVAAFSRRTAAFLQKNPTSKNAQVNAWGLVLSNASDDYTRRYAISRIRKLGGDVVQTPEGVRLIPPQED